LLLREKITATRENVPTQRNPKKLKFSEEY